MRDARNTQETCSLLASSARKIFFYHRSFLQFFVRENMSEFNNLRVVRDFKST